MSDSDPKLTNKQRRFVEEYLVDMNATQAAMRAGYSKVRASEIGYQLLRKTTVLAGIQAAMKARSERTEVTSYRVIRELSYIAFADMGEVADWDGETCTLRRSIDMPRHVRRAIEEVSNTTRGTKVKFASKIAALDLLMKHLGMFSPTVTKQVGLFSINNEPIDAETRELMKKILISRSNEAPQTGED